MADEPKLQYIRGVVKESLRFLPSTILGIVPHATTSRDVYNGYEIPAKTGVMVNVWALNNDPERYPNPRVFDPDRYKDDFLRAQESATLSDPYKRDHFTVSVSNHFHKAGYWILIMTMLSLVPDAESAQASMLPNGPCS